MCNTLQKHKAQQSMLIFDTTVTCMQPWTSILLSYLHKLFIAPLPFNTLLTSTLTFPSLPPQTQLRSLQSLPVDLGPDMGYDAP